MITHEQARKEIEIIENFIGNNSDYYTNVLKQYITQQEKKDKLLELYKECLTMPNDYAYSDIWKQIKALEREELK